MFRRILVAFDGSNGSKKALDRAIALAAASGAEIHSVSVEIDLPHYVATVGEFEEVKRQKDEFFRSLSEDAIHLAAKSGVKLIPHILSGHVVDVISDFCNENAFDLIVVGFSGHGRLFERIWGGTSRNIARFAPCSVLIVK